MVARKANILFDWLVRVMSSRVWWVFSVLVFTGLSMVQVGSAQDLINSGQIRNSGTIRVRGEAVGLPSAVDGIFEYFGADQIIPATQYQGLVLSGSGTKTTVGGSFGVTGTIAIATAVTLAVEPGEIITLGGTLDEQGLLTGSIGKSVILSGGTTSSDFGNIGTTISWTDLSPGFTTVIRTSGIASTGEGNESIKRYYDIAPTFGTGLNATYVFRYSDNELNGQDPSTLELWRSLDGGATWRRPSEPVRPVRVLTDAGLGQARPSEAARSSQSASPVPSPRLLRRP